MRSNAQNSVRVAAAQYSFSTGDLSTNLETIKRASAEAIRRDIDVLVFPELTLTGMVAPELVPKLALPINSDELRELAATTATGPAMSIGFIEHGRNQLFYNSQAYLEDGAIQYVQRKIYLPGYGMFDESRSFASGETYGAFDTKYGRCALLICEDAWHTSLPYAASADGAAMLFTSAASPAGGTSADLTSQELWLTVNRATAVTLKCCNIFANRVGSDRHLNYWGGSHIIAPSGRIMAEGSPDSEELVSAHIDLMSIAIERHNYRYVQDERLDLTIRELKRIGAQRWKAQRQE